jgi:hypothetical protein
MRHVVTALLLLVSTSAMAGTSAGYEMGGRFMRFDPVVNEANQSDELFRIEGHCQSACTLFLGIRNVSSIATRRCCFVPVMTGPATSTPPPPITC